MTTIAAKDGTMASDARCTNDDASFATRMSKVFRLDNKALLGCSGDADCRDVIALLNKATLKKLPSRAELAATRTDFGGLMLFPNGTLYYIDIQQLPNSPDWVASVVECKERFAAVGSGAAYALGAMAAGRSAKQSVEIACRFDTMSGPPVTEYQAKPSPKQAT